MLIVRAAVWPDDESRIELVDTSFSCDRIYRLTRDGLGLHLREEEVRPPARKAYASPPLAGQEGVFVVEDDGEVIGFGQVEYEAWNRRARIAHLYVSAPHRGRGAGTALLQALARRASSWEARCIWLETQNVNYPAVQFYLRQGFRLCGLDETLYDPQALPGEVALFLARDL
jgi:ribosomal protein S18 acetylase RimI-like enzyme